MHPALIAPDLTGLERSVYDILRTQGADGLSQARIVSLLHLSASKQSTISRTLSKLIAAGLVRKTGATRNAVFSLTPEARWFSVPGPLRPRVDYDRGRIRDYDPNTSPWLKVDASDLMAQAAGDNAIRLDPSTYTREIAERFLIELSWASSALEGNTYSLLETEVLIKHAEAAVGKSETEVQMILNHKAAIGWLIDNIEQVEVTPETVMRLHAMLMRGLVRQNNLGTVRRDPVNITTSSYAPSADHAELLMGLGELCLKANQANSPFESSFALLIGTAYLQAFIDGNKRTGRLLCNIPLLKAGLPPISFVGVGRQDYGIGMTTWYELGDTSYLSKAISEGYAVSAPAYIVAAATKRVPRSVEIRMRHRLDKAIGDYVQAIIDGRNVSPAEFAREAFSDLEDSDLQLIKETFEDIVAGLNEVNGTAYGLNPAIVSSYLEAKSDAPSHRR